MTAPLPPWRGRDNLSRIAHQAVVDRTNQSSNLRPSGGFEILSTRSAKTIADNRGPDVPEIFLGSIATVGPDGDADFTDGRYWVRMQGVYSTGPTTQPAIGDDDEVEAEQTANSSNFTIIPRTVEGLYVPDVLTGGHTLVSGDSVIIIGFYKREVSTPAGIEKEYLIVPLEKGGSSSPSLVLVQVTATWRAGIYIGKVEVQPPAGSYAIGADLSATLGTLSLVSSQILVGNLSELNQGTNTGSGESLRTGAVYQAQYRGIITGTTMGAGLWLTSGADVVNCDEA